jgi:hypothetical protein
MRHFHILAIGCLLLCTVRTTAQEPNASRSDPKGSDPNTTVRLEYPLNPKCGPWMVMVKSFQSQGNAQAIDYANRLARELRDKYKIAAYTYVKQPEQQVIQQTGFTRGRVRQYVTAAVIAGDCKNEKAAAKLQDQIQNIRPATITQDMVPKYQWAAGPLRTAFCMPNPMAPSMPTKPDPALTKMNSGPQSLLRCPSEYTLEVALFTGGIAFTKKDAEKLEKASLLEAAGEHAEHVTSELRRMGFDAYVYHGLTYSLVTVGGFSTTQDPQAEQLAKQLAAMKVGPFTLSPAPRLIKVPEK